MDERPRPCRLAGHAALVWGRLARCRGWPDRRARGRADGRMRQYCTHQLMPTRLHGDRAAVALLPRMLFAARAVQQGQCRLARIPNLYSDPQINFAIRCRSPAAPASWPSVAM